FHYCFFILSNRDKGLPMLRIFQCGHAFHYGCILKVDRKGQRYLKTCPICFKKEAEIIEDRQETSGDTDETTSVTSETVVVSNKTNVYQIVKRHLAYVSKLGVLKQKNVPSVSKVDDMMDKLRGIDIRKIKGNEL